MLANNLAKKNEEVSKNISGEIIEFLAKFQKYQKNCQKSEI